MSHAAVLLAGGRSSRMGRDKSALIVNTHLLWHHQLDTLRATNPAELFISGRSDGPYAGCGVEILADESPDCGPLGGIATTLRRCKSDYLLVLAVDMPAMTTEFLRTLLKASQRTGSGVIPSLATDDMKRSDFQSAMQSTRLLPSAARRSEPLAAVYPRAALALADECLGTGEFKLETFIRRLEAHQLVSVRAAAQKDAALFANWNAPEDVREPQS